MMKNRKPLSTKKPPSPNDSYDLIEDWIANVKPALNPIVTVLDELIRKQFDDTKYAIKWGKAYYGSPKTGWCIELVAYNVSVNIVFLNGDKLVNPPELGEETRYFKIKELEDIKSSQLEDWISQSCQMKGWAW